MRWFAFFLLLSPIAGIAQIPFSAADLIRQNPAAGTRSRDAFVFPAGVSVASPNTQTFELVFDAELDVDAYQRFLRLCYITTPGGARPVKSRCVQEIRARIISTSGPGKDRVLIEVDEPIDLGRDVALWVDLINPSSQGFYRVELWSASELVKTWNVPVEHPNFDGPGTGD